MEHVLTMANLKLKPYLFMPRPSVYLCCYTINFCVCQHPGFDFSGAEMSGNYSGGGPQFGQ